MQNKIIIQFDKLIIMLLIVFCLGFDIYPSYLIWLQSIHIFGWCIVLGVGHEANKKIFLLFFLMLEIIAFMGDVVVIIVKIVNILKTSWDRKR